MDVPQPPQDEELKNIIDKLAVFVARNGPEFESMTKQKQQGNPRFQFLYGGEHFNYYMYRVTSEQAILKHRAQQPPNQRPPSQQGGNHFGANSGSFLGDHNANPFQQQQGQPPRFPFDQGPGGSGPRPGSRFDRGPPQGPNPFQAAQQQQQMRMPFQQQQQPRPHFNLNQFPPRGPNPFDLPQSQPQSQGQAGDFVDYGHGRGQGQGQGHGFHQNQAQNDGQGQGQNSRPFPLDYDQRNANQSGFDGGGVGGRHGRSRFDIGPGPGQEPAFPKGHIQGQGFPPPQQQQQQPPPPNPQLLATLSSELDSLKKQKQGLEEQVKQSEQNLVAQHQVLMGQQQQQIEESLRILQQAEIKQLAAELNISLPELDATLEPIIETCTKDSISGGKAWIFTHTSTPRHYQLLSMYLLQLTTDSNSNFTKRLHIIYLVNDVLHHCMRKGAEDLRQVLEAMVIPMFSHAKVKEAGNPENLAKLDKLLNLWESKCQYVSPIAVDKLKDPGKTWVEYHNELMKRHAVVVAQIVQNVQKTYEGYQSQHQLFCQHNLQSIAGIEQKLQQLQQQLSQLQASLPPPANLPPPSVVIPKPSLLGPPPGPPLSLPPHLPTSNSNANNITSHSHSPQQQQQQKPPDPPSISASQNEAVPIPDISKPPPGFPPPSEKELVPSLPYYELPAGLMVPLVKPEDDNYKPLDPKAIRLPPPCPPSERLMQAIELFYAPPSHERPRDSEGWERLGLYEYYKAKNIARKQKEDDIREGRRQKSKSPSPIRRDSSPSGRSKSPPRRRYQSKSPTPDRNNSRRRSRSRSRSPVSRRRSRRRSRSRSRSPIRRSPTPPSFGTPGLGLEMKLDESNKGHQLLKKMGWGGSGLGANEQGIEAPISGGEVRSKREYRGVGISMNDPFESYRKSKGQAFVERMRQRAEERP